MVEEEIKRKAISHAREARKNCLKEMKLILQELRQLRREVTLYEIRKDFLLGEYRKWGEVSLYYKELLTKMK
jgi:hypothetical protein